MKRQKCKRRITIILLLLLVFIGIHKEGSRIFQFIADQMYIKKSISYSSLKNTQTNQDTETIKLHSPYTLLINLRENKVLLDEKSEEKIYPASLTKIMTAIIAMERISQDQQSIFLPPEMFQKLYEANASMAGFLPYEEVSAIDLLYGILLPSGADASTGVALHIAGSESNFVKLMNEKAKELGMKDTHFTNVNGFHDDEHYTTLKDMSILLQYALENETFREIFTTKRHVVPPTNKHPQGFTLFSTMFEKLNTYDFPGGKFLGGKTGYTQKAGLCLASLAEKNGEEYLLLTAGAPGNHNTEQYHLIDALTVYGNI